MKKKHIFIILIIFLISVTIFIQIAYKISNSGNNISKSDKFDILNISSYEALAEVQVNSNRNTNKYILRQEYFKPNILKQEVIEPENIKGLTTTFDGTNLTIENKSLNLKQIYENYSYITGNNLSLIGFIDEYNKAENRKKEETENEDIMQIEIKNGKNKYERFRKLYIDKKSNLPTKMEILDVNQNIIVYILYREIKINETGKEDILGV